MTMEERLKEIGKAWEKDDGTIRYYVNNWREMIDLKVGYYKTGNVSDVTYKGNKCSNNWYRKHCSLTKVWVSPSGDVHVDYCEDDDVIRDIKKTIQERLMEGEDERDKDQSE